MTIPSKCQGKAQALQGGKDPSRPPAIGPRPNTGRHQSTLGSRARTIPQSRDEGASDEICDAASGSACEAEHSCRRGRPSCEVVNGPSAAAPAAEIYAFPQRRRATNGARVAIRPLDRLSPAHNRPSRYPRGARCHRRRCACSSEASPCVHRRGGVLESQVSALWPVSAAQ